LIEEDEQFEEQEAWLEDSQYMFLALETVTKFYLESQLPINVKKRQPNDTKNRREREISVSQSSMETSESMPYSDQISPQ